MGKALQPGGTAKAKAMSQKCLRVPEQQFSWSRRSEGEVIGDEVTGWWG